MALVYNMDGAAERLHKSRRWLQDWLRDHPADERGVPFYSPLGRTKTFTTMRSDALYCSPRCRQRAHRSVTADKQTSR
jgi:hypothetical protein